MRKWIKALKKLCSFGFTKEEKNTAFLGQITITTALLLVKY